MNKPVDPVVIIGCGDIGTQVAAHYLKKNHSVQALIRSESSSKRLATFNIIPFQLDLIHAFNNPLQTNNSLLYYFAPPPTQGVHDLHITNFIQAIHASKRIPKKIVYISTTGVYGDCNGRWITEEEPTKPLADRAKRRLDAEQQLQKWASTAATNIVILRVAGIYGPNKLPLDRLKKQLPVIRSSESPFTNRIHSEDLVHIAIAAMERGKNGEIYHACDGQPGTMTDYFKQIAHYANLPTPPEISLSEGHLKLSSGMMSYMQESRRLSNAKTLKELAVTLKYPTLTSGLKQCFSG